jgi:hypothetical protein
LNEKLGTLNERFQNLLKLHQQMTATNQNDRPDCKSILEQKLKWSLEISHLKDNHFVVNVDKCFEIVSPENYFLSRFIKFKFKSLYQLKPQIYAKPKVNVKSGRILDLSKKFEKNKMLNGKLPKKFLLKKFFTLNLT